MHLLKKAPSRRHPTVTLEFEPVTVQFLHCLLYNLRRLHAIRKFLVDVEAPFYLANEAEARSSDDFVVSVTDTKRNDPRVRLELNGHGRERSRDMRRQLLVVRSFVAIGVDSILAIPERKMVARAT